MTHKPRQNKNIYKQEKACLAFKPQKYIVNEK